MLNKEKYDTVTSTNDLMKERVLTSVPRVITAECQTAGRGRYGRSFYSPPGTGIYMSVGFALSFFPEDHPARCHKDFDPSFFTYGAAVATCRAIERICSVAPGIKPINDLLIDGRKICGILTEGVPDPHTGRITGIVIGIGVNCFTGSFPEEMKDVAGCISEDPGSFSRDELSCAIVEELLAALKAPAQEIFSEYESRRVL